MANPTVEGLIAFVNEQPADQLVDDRSDTTCAVGRYVQQVTGLDENNLKLFDAIHKFIANPAIDGHIAWRIYSSGGSKRTYGDVQKMIRNHYDLQVNSLG